MLKILILPFAIESLLSLLLSMMYLKYKCLFSFLIFLFVLSLIHTMLERYTYSLYSYNNMFLTCYFDFIFMIYFMCKQIFRHLVSRIVLISSSLFYMNNISKYKFSILCLLGREIFSNRDYG